MESGSRMAMLTLIATFVLTLLQIAEKLNLAASVAEALRRLKVRFRLTGLHLPKAVDYVGPGYSAWLLGLFVLMIWSLVSLSFMASGPGTDRPATVKDIILIGVNLLNVVMASMAFNRKSPREATKDLKHQYLFENTTVDRLERIEEYVGLLAKLAAATRPPAANGATPQAPDASVPTANGQVAAGPPARSGA
jgi:hypothetical protein